MCKPPTYVYCIIVIAISAKVLTQHCYKKCSCLKKSLTLNHCSQTVDHLNVELHPKEIVISCRNSISRNPEDIQSFDANYLTAIAENSPLTLASMAKKCYKTKEKVIRYTLDVKKLNNITATKALLSGEIFITHLRLENKLNAKHKANLTLLQTDFLTYGSHLNTLIVNNLRIPNLERYFDNVSHIETLDLASNHIEFIPDAVFDNMANLRHLNLKDNKITALSQKTLQGLDNITSLDVSFNGIKHLAKEMFPTVGNMKFLNLSRNNLKTIDSDTFSIFSKLENLDLAENSELTLQPDVFSNLTELKSLNLSGCHLTNIPTKFLYRSLNLDVLNISRNAISKLANDSFQNLTELRVVDLSYNNLEILPTALLEPLKKLQRILLGFNKLSVFNPEVFWKVYTLETIDLRHNLIDRFYNPLAKFKANNVVLRNNKICKFPSIFLVNVVGLQNLDLSHNSISSVELMKELIHKTSKIAVDLSHNQISRLNITKMEKSNGNWKIMLDLSQNKVKCNCMQYKIDQVPQSSRAQTAILQLTSKENICFNSFPHENCPLIYVKGCPRSCNCYYTRINNAIYVDCSYRNLTTFPEIGNLATDRYDHEQTLVRLNGNRLNLEGQEVLKSYKNITKLDLSDNQIEELKWLPGNVKELILSNNRLTSLSEEIVEHLRKNEFLRTVSLENNPWDCDCKAVHLQKYLIQYNNLKIGQSEVICNESGESLAYTKVCENQSVLKVALPLGLTAALAMISAALALYFKYNTSIKVYLYSKNLCLWCVAEEEIDKEKTFDIFISYSHKDEGFVQKELLPELESGDTPFKICIHYRDWLPGEFISTQIVSSVLDSRRTLVILSNNFMESVWGKMEFRTAHLQAINEGRARVIVVLFGDLDESVLDDEMKTYLRTNTYVKWGDPWFWSKLKYALPHSKVKNWNLPHQSQESFHLK